MSTEVALSPKLNLSPAEFARAWNASPKHRAAAIAQTPDGIAKSYDPALAQQIVLDLTLGVMGGLIVELIVALIDELAPQSRPKKRVRTKEILRPDGTYIFIVEQEEE